jgi:hypothetical protein
VNLGFVCYVLIACLTFGETDSCLQKEKCALATSRDNLDKLYRDASNSLTILERSHRFTREELDNHRYKLQESLDDVIRLRQLVSTKDTVIKDLRQEISRPGARNCSVGCQCC